MRTRRSTIFSLLTILIATGILAADDIYVDGDTGDDEDPGNTWANAFKTLQRALEEADDPEQEPDIIWVADGTYVPDTPSGRGATFGLVNKTWILGGFEGQGGAEEGHVKYRDPLANVTILSGEIGDAGISDNIINVVTADTVDDDTTLDGFTITRGYENDGLGGAGLRLVDSDAFIVRCIFFDNIADDTESSDGNGGGALIDGGDPFFINCEFVSNQANHRGGGMYCRVLTAPTLLGTTFFDNEAFDDGGAIYAEALAGAYLVNCTVARNHARDETGGIFRAGAQGFAVENTILWMNTDESANTGQEGEQVSSNAGNVFSYSVVQGWTGNQSGTNTNSDNPAFKDVVGGDLRLTTASHSIDWGLNSLVEGNASFKDAFDLDGDGVFIELTPDLLLTERIRNVLVDRGAYEFYCAGDLNKDAVVDFKDLLAWLGSEMGPYDCPPLRPEDADRDCEVDFEDLVIVLSEWTQDGGTGGCFHPVQPAPEVDSLAEVIVGMGLQWPDDWNSFLGWIQNGTPAEQENAGCWMDHYYLAHYLEVCLCSPSCPGADPWGGHHSF